MQYEKNAPHSGAVNELQWWGLSAGSGWTLLTTPDGHTIGSMRKSWFYVQMCQNSSGGPSPRLVVTLSGWIWCYWIPWVGFLLVFGSNYRPMMHRLAAVHARDQATNDRPTDRQCHNTICQMSDVHNKYLCVRLIITKKKSQRENSTTKTYSNTKKKKNEGKGKWGSRQPRHRTGRRRSIWIALDCAAVVIVHIGVFWCFYVLCLKCEGCETWRECWFKTTCGDLLLLDIWFHKTNA